MTTLTQDQVFAAIHQERLRQKTRWGSAKPQSLPGYILLAEKEVNQAKIGYADNLSGRHSPLSELLQAAAVIVAALEQYGIEGSAIATNDEPAPTSRITANTSSTEVATDVAERQGPLFAHTALRN